MLQHNSGNNLGQYRLGADEVSARLSIAKSTLNAWLKMDDARPLEHQLFKFHQWVGNKRRWSEEGYRLLERAIHMQSESGVLSTRTRVPAATASVDPDAEASLREVLCQPRPRSY